jgi:hypothetical protein
MTRAAISSPLRKGIVPSTEMIYIVDDDASVISALGLVAFPAFLRDAIVRGDPKRADEVR